jgi:hypothetical protein
MANPFAEPAPDQRSLSKRAFALALDIAGDAPPEALAAAEAKLVEALKLQWVRGYSAASQRRLRKAERKG